jgi:hypothetical protein
MIPASPAIFFLFAGALLFWGWAGAIAWSGQQAAAPFWGPPVLFAMAAALATLAASRRFGRKAGASGLGILALASCSGWVAPGLWRPVAAFFGPFPLAWAPSLGDAGPRAEVAALLAVAVAFNALLAARQCWPQERPRWHRPAWATLWGWSAGLCAGASAGTLGEAGWASGMSAAAITGAWLFALAWAWESFWPREGRGRRPASLLENAFPGGQLVLLTLLCLGLTPDKSPGWELLPAIVALGAAQLALARGARESAAAEQKAKIAE